MKKALVYILVACVIFALQPSVLAADDEMQVCTDPMSGTQITVPSTWPTRYAETSDEYTRILWNMEIGEQYSFISYHCADISEKFAQIKGRTMRAETWISLHLHRTNWLKSLDFTAYLVIMTHITE